MIIDFTVSNFRSIKDEQTFSLYAEKPGTHLVENISYPAENDIGILKSAGLYGANASGKSNLLLAFEALRYIICGSENLKDGESIPWYHPFLLSKSTKSAPTKFEIEFVISKKRYRYNVAYTDKKIIKEELHYFSSASSAVIFKRTEIDTWKSISFGSYYKGGKKRLPFFDNNAYLSNAGNSADTPEIIREIYNFFRTDVFHLGVNENFARLNWLEDNELVSRVSSLLTLVDTGINGISVIERTDDDSLHLPDRIPERLKQAILKDRKKKVLFSHLTDSGTTELFEEKEESAGTRKLFNLAPLIIDALLDGGVLILDELDNSMHPFMAELIIKLFNDPHVNKNNAQLIFSTHNINLMSPEHLRRDQIWFTEKNKGITKFYSLDDFDKKKVKPQSPFNLWYAEGRFGAVPTIDYQGIVEIFNMAREHHAEKE